MALQTITLDSPAPVAGASFQATVEVSEHRDGAAAEAPGVAHRRHDREAVSPTLNLPPGARSSTSSGSPSTARGSIAARSGSSRTTARSLDNRLYFAVTVDQQIPVAIVKPRLDEVPQADDAFYLERALAPAGSTGGAFRVTTLTPESLATAGPVRLGRDLLRQPSGPAAAGGREALGLRSRRRATSSGSAAATSSPWPTTR